VAALCLRAMAKDRAQRYATPVELRDAALAVLAELEGRATVGHAVADPRRRLWWWCLPTPLALLALPYVLGPLCDLNPSFHLPRLDAPAGWGAWLTASLVSTGLTALAVHHRQSLIPPAWTGLTTVLATLALGGLMTGLTVSAILAAADLQNTAWSAAIPLAVIGAGVSWLGWQGRAWWRDRIRGPGGPTMAMLIPAMVLLLMASAAHLLQGEPPPRTVEEDRGSLLGFLHRESPRTVIDPRPVQPAVALAVGAPFVMALIVPFLLRRRR